MKSDCNPLKILVLECSPRLRGNTNRLMDNLLGSVEERIKCSEPCGMTIERLNVSKMAIGGCTACMSCKKDGDCVIQDDMSVIYRQFDEADLIIVATPTFYNSIPAQAKAMVDRCQIYWSRRFALGRRKTVKNKKAILISTAGSESQNARIGVFLTMDLFFTSIDAKLLSHWHIGGLDGLEDDSVRRMFSEVEIMKDIRDEKLVSVAKQLSQITDEFKESILSMTIDS